MSPKQGPSGAGDRQREGREGAGEGGGERERERERATDAVTHLHACATIIGDTGRVLHQCERLKGALKVALGNGACHGPPDRDSLHSTDFHISMLQSPYYPP